MPEPTPASIARSGGSDADAGGELHAIQVQVNGVEERLSVEPRETLADVLRHRLGLTGTHLGCEHGICGACTVLVEGVPTRSCLVFGVQADDRSVETVEGLAPDGELSELQRAFRRHHALQCGFCTPGFLMLATALLREPFDHPRDDISAVVSSNLCRCTGYRGIIDAIEELQNADRSEELS